MRGAHLLIRRARPNGTIKREPPPFLHGSRLGAPRQRDQAVSRTSTSLPDLERFDDKLPLEQNILRHILYRNGFLHEEAELLLRQELADPHNHVSTLRAIANGRTRNGEIMDWTGLSSAQTRQITSTLERMRLIEQRRPVTASPRSKKTSYAIADGFLNFHFRFVDSHR